MRRYKVALPLAALALLAAACRTEVIAPEVPESPGEVITPSAHPILFSSLRDSTYGVNQRPNLEVMKMSASGSEIVNISKHPASDTDASWSPDGKYVAFASNRNGGFDIFVMREDGSEVRQLTWDTLDERFPRWSPDGKNIVFESPRDGLIPKPGYPRYSDLFVVTSDGSHMYNLTRTPARSERWATWSPDGKTIAYTRSDSTATQIYLINPDGTGARPLRTPAPGYLDDAAAWSPDGSRIAFSAFNLNHPMYIETFVIFSVRTDGSDLQALTGTGYDSARFPAWSPDGKHILFNRDNLDEWWGRFSTQNLWIMNSDGSGKTRITQDASRRNELGSPDAWRE